MSTTRLTEAERVLIAKGGDHHPETCDCSVYAEDGGYPEHDICTGLAETFAAVESILAARLAEARTQAVLDYLENAQPHIIQEAETAGARKVRKRVEAVLRERCDSMSRSTYDVHGGWVHMESVRAALVEDEVGT